MYQSRKLRLTASILLYFLLQAEGADKYTDENRPYEFGFKIDGQQHRHESKDKDGIIMGEFGFVTADDVYHVTVYATDKEGRFKILSMKNIHLKSTRQGHSLALRPAQPASVQGPAPLQPASAPQPGKQFNSISIEPPGRSCSSCSIPTTTRVPPPTTFKQTLPNQFSAPSPQNQPTFPPAPTSNQNNAQGGLGGSSYSPQAPQNYPAGPQQGPDAPALQNYPQQPGPSPPNYPGPSAPNSSGAGQQPGIPQAYPEEQNILTGGVSGPAASEPSSYPQVGAGQRTPKRYNSPPQQFGSNGKPNGLLGPGFAPGVQRGSAKPVLVTAQMQLVDKNTDIHALRPGEKEGLPPGLTKNDMTQLLYTFNYTVGFHGHFEEGYTNGVKKGYYFVTGRNGVRTRIDYVADDTGFHPKVSQDVLDLLSDDVPKAETEKDEKFGLKGYEFKWLYYPVEPKRT